MHQLSVRPQWEHLLITDTQNIRLEFSLSWRFILSCNIDKPFADFSWVSRVLRQTLGNKIKNILISRKVT